jgi:hypothetical protein
LRTNFEPLPSIAEDDRETSTTPFDKEASFHMKNRPARTHIQIDARESKKVTGSQSLTPII